MNELKAVKKVENMIIKILEDRFAELDDLDEQIKTQAEIINHANKELAAATAQSDVKRYQEAKNEIRKAADAREMYEARRNALDKKPLITETEYQKAITEIFNEIAAIDDQTKQKIAKCAEEMQAAALDLQDNLKKANEILGKLQHDIYADADRSKNQKGEIYYVDGETKRVDANKWATVKWGKVAVEHHQYKLYTGRETK